MDFRKELLSKYDGLYRWALKLTKNPDSASDLVHETVVLALMKQDMFQPGTNLWGWLSKLQYNIFVTQYRRAAKFGSQFDPAPIIDGLSTPPPQHTQVEFSFALDKLRQLSPDMQEVLRGVMLGETYDEIAARLAIPSGTVRSRIHRAREALRA